LTVRIESKRGKKSLLNGIDINMESTFIQKTEGNCTYKVLATLGFAFKGHFGIRANLIQRKYVPS